MARGVECECSSIEVNGFIYVRQDALILKSILEAAGQVVETGGLKGMTRGTECKCSSMKVNGLIQVRQGTLPLKSVLETEGKVVESG